MAGKGDWEGYREHADRIHAEKARAENEGLCPVVVNDEWAHGYTGRKVCLKKPSPDALQLDLRFCGTHLKQHLKGEREMAEERARRAQAAVDAERRKIVQEARDAQEKAIEELLMKRGFKELSITRSYGFYGRKKRPWTVTIPLNVAFELVDELPMITPDEAAEVKERELEEAERAQTRQHRGEVPF